MELPQRDVAVAWVGRTIVDRDGTEIGACTAVFADDATQLAEWVCSELGGVAVLIPAVGAAESSGQVRVAVSRADVAGAPLVAGDRHVSMDEEVALYRHYGIPHSQDESATVLPTGVAEDGGAADPTPDGAAATAVPQPPAAAPEPAPAAAAADRPLGADAPLAADAPLGMDAPLEVDAPLVTDAPPLDSDEAPAGGRGRSALLSGGLAGLAVAVGAVLGVRRLRGSRPRTRTERLAERGRAASVALGARTGELAASAAPVLDAGRQVVRGRAGAAVGAVSAVVASLLAARRGGSGEVRSDDVYCGDVRSD